MANDVLKKVIANNEIKNGTAVVSIDKFGNIDNSKVDTTSNTTYQVLAQSGVLQDRLDEVRYYTGDQTT